LNRLAFDLFSGTIEQSDALNGLAALIWRYADDDRVRAVLEDTSENWYVRRGHKFFLYEYELHLMVDGNQIPDFVDFTSKGKEERTTEHILPQNPAEDADCWWSAFTLEEHVALRHSLGNLVLTLDNSSYGRKCFAQKRGEPLSPGATETNCYAQSSLHQERKLALHPEWTPATIRERQAQLADWAMSRWSVSPPTAALLESVEAAPEIDPDDDQDAA
jgi:hypothetical protein